MWRLLLLLCITSCGPLTEPAYAGAAHRAEAARLEQAYQLPTGLLSGICEVESSWLDPTPNGAHGEVGLCQLKANTVRMFCPTCEVAASKLYQGARSPAVKSLQVELTRKKYNPGTPDGVFGLKTHIAVTRFQTEMGLRPDGIVGPKTWKALFGYPMDINTIAEQLKDPYKNLEYAARYLSWLRAELRTNDPDILAAAYNGGPASKAVEYMLKVRAANE